ncbi:hypothetical protein ABT281_32010, partial [Streptomyces filamentosus]
AAVRAQAHLVHLVDDAPLDRLHAVAGWFAADDPAPALAMGRAWLAHLLRRALAAGRRRLTAARPRHPAALPAQAGRTSTTRLTRLTRR